MSEVEEREAALFNGYHWKDWLELERTDRIDGVAHYRINQMIEMHKQDAVAKVIKRKSRRT